MKIKYLTQADSTYPVKLVELLGNDAPAKVATLGNLDILKNRLVALLCSVRCPGSLILQTYDFVRNLRKAGMAVVGGFHSPVESECLRILLRGTSPVIICPARRIDNLRVRSELKKPVEEGRILFLSPFSGKQKRISKGNAVFRNLFVAALADAIFVAHAEPNSKTERFCRKIIECGKPVYTIEDKANANLNALGIKPVNPASISELM